MCGAVSGSHALYATRKSIGRIDLLRGVCSNEDQLTEEQFGEW